MLDGIFDEDEISFKELTLSQFMGNCQFGKDRKQKVLNKKLENYYCKE